MMEIRARYFLIGLFVLAVIAGAVGFVYWLYAIGGLTERTAYQVRFTGSVSGLSPGSEVTFNGVQVGEVVGVEISPDDPADVIVVVAIDARIPVRSDTKVGMAFQGLTGTPTVALTGGSPSAPPPTGDPPLLVADSAALKDLTESARDTLAQLSDILTDNAEPLTNAIANIDTFSDALARNAENLDVIVEGLVRLTGGGASRGDTIAYDLTAPTGFPASVERPSMQLTVPSPTAVVVLDTQRILIEHDDGALVPAFEDVRWADSVPLLVQARVIEGLENAGFTAVGTDFSAVSGDDQLAIDLRAFQVRAGPAPTAYVAFMAKVVDSFGQVIDARLFTASEPAAAVDDPALAAAALDRAFGRAASELVVWALATMSAGATP